MTTISTVPRICTLVNVFTVDPQNQERLLESLMEYAGLHLSDDSEELRRDESRQLCAAG